METTHVAFNPKSLQWALVVLLLDGSSFHITVSSYAIEELKKKGAFSPASAFNGVGPYDKHMSYWPLIKKTGTIDLSKQGGSVS